MMRLRYAYAAVHEHVKDLKVDCIPNIIRSHYIVLSVVWLLLLLFSATCCTWLIVQTFHEYQTHQVTTTTRYLNDRQPLFPTITMCPMNPFNTPYAIEMLRAANISNLTGEQYINYASMLRIEHYMNETRGSYMTLEEKSRLSSLESMLVVCTFQNRACNVSDFEYMFHPFYLGCYRFNANGSRRTYLSGNQNQLSVELYVGMPDEMNTQMLKGVHIFIQNHTDFPLMKTPSPYATMPSVGSVFILNRLEYEQKESPYSECTITEGDDDESHRTPSLIKGTTFDSFFFSLAAHTNYTYSQDVCLHFCELILVSSKIGCLSYQVGLNTSGLIDYCLNDTQIIMEAILYDFISNGAVPAVCEPLCPLECHKRIFQTTINNFKYPYSDEYVKLLKYIIENSNMSYIMNQSDYIHDLANNMASFSVYYESLAYTQVVEEPKMSAEVLLGTIGGHLHLFMGMSLLSFVEIAELLCLFALNLVKKRQILETKPL